MKYRNPDTGRFDERGASIPVDYAGIAEGYGCKVWRVTNSDELRVAVNEAKASHVSTLIDIKVGFDSMSDGYESWWRVGTPEVSEKPEVIEALEGLKSEIGNLKQF